MSVAPVATGSRPRDNLGEHSERDQERNASAGMPPPRAEVYSQQCSASLPMNEDAGIVQC